jgi:hypothetical protein
LLKNGHLLRFPHPSSLRRTAKYALWPVHQLAGVARSRSLLIATPLSGFREPPQGRDFAKLNLHLPACRSLGAGRTLFEQPGKHDFFNSLIDLKERNVYGRDEISKECKCPNCFLLTTKR